MNLEKIIEVLAKRYKDNNNNIAFPAPYIVSLLAKPTDEQIDQLKNGDGSPIKEICQINSSAGLAFNYYKLFEQEKQKEQVDFKVNFEVKVAKPLLLKNGGKNANLDVSYCLGGTQYYIESKFLEPYYNKCNHKGCSYYNKDKYGNHVDNYQFDKEETDKWLELLKHEKDFQYYDFPQLYHHLLAIRRKHNKEGNVVLQCVSWKMTNEFKKEYGLQKSDKDWLDKLEQEREKADSLFNDFLKKIRWTGCRFETKYYNDMLEDISKSNYFKQFILQYFMKECVDGNEE